MWLADAQQSTSFVNDVLVPVIPWLLIFVFLFFVFRRQIPKQKEAVQRMQQHRAALEAKLDRIIELLERRNSL